MEALSTVSRSLGGFSERGRGKAVGRQHHGDERGWRVSESRWTRTEAEWAMQLNGTGDEDGTCEILRKLELKTLMVTAKQRLLGIERKKKKMIMAFY